MRMCNLVLHLPKALSLYPIIGSGLGGVTLLKKIAWWNDNITPFVNSV